MRELKDNDADAAGLILALVLFGIGVSFIGLFLAEVFA